MIIDEAVYLEHYGVKGMKWGVRRDLRRESKQARRNEKAQKYFKKAHILDTKISELQSSTASKYSLEGIGNRRKIETFSEERDKALSDADAKSKGKLTSTQKKVLLGAGAVAAIVGAAGVYHLTQSGEARRLMTKGKDFLTNRGNDPGWKLDRSLADPMNADQIMKKVVSKINPDYGAPGTKVNCRRATFAYEMRRRGYDVSATRTTNSHGQNLVGIRNALSPRKEPLPTGESGIRVKAALESYRENRAGGPGRIDTPLLDVIREAKQYGEHDLNPSSIFQDMKKVPSGARGELGIGWLSGGGHSVAWEKIGDQLVIFDTQSGEKYTSQADFKELADSMSFLSYTRLDDKNLNTNFLLRWLKDA